MISTDGYWRKARLKFVVDGDTIRLLIDLGYRTFAEHSIRLSGVSSPRIHRGIVNPEERTEGIRAREFVLGWFERHTNTCSDYRERWPILVNTERSDGFGRYLGKIYCTKHHCLNDELLQSGYAKPFAGIAE